MSCSCCCGHGRGHSDNRNVEVIQLGHKPAGRNLRFGYARQTFRETGFQNNIIKGKYKNNYVSTCLYPRGLPSTDRYQHRGPFNIACVGTSLNKNDYLT